MEKNLTEYLKFFNIEQEFKGAYSKIHLIKIDGEKMIIKKTNRNDYYKAEKEVLLKLQYWEDCFPKIKYYDDANRIIIINYVGETLKKHLEKNPNFNLADHEEKMYECNTKLKRAGYYHNDIHDENVCIDDKGIIRFIDFQIATRNQIHNRKKFGPFSYRKWSFYKPGIDHEKLTKDFDKKYNMPFHFGAFYDGKYDFKWDELERCSRINVNK
tara:strand:+ start:149 stop:787 length:639 start_codon:yes stop_codon:yes gene_type:complete